MTDLTFNSYQELTDYCYPFEKNLGSREWTDDEKHLLLDQIGRFFRQRLDEIAEQLGSKYTLLVHVTMDSTYWGLCWLDERIIELNPSLICYPPLVLTETIIHELTHYQYFAHGKRFYTLVEKNVQKLGLQHVLYGWQGVRYPASVLKITKQMKKETYDEIKKFFRLSYTSRSKWKPIPNGAPLNLPKDWPSFTTPPHVNIPRVQGLLNRAELVYHAERTFRNYVLAVAPFLDLDLKGYDITVSNKCGFDLKERKINFPVWLIGMQQDMGKRYIISFLTRMQGSDKYFRLRLAKNLSHFRLDNVPPPSHHCLLQIFKPWESALFDEKGKPKIKYEGTSLEEKNERTSNIATQQLVIPFDFC